MWRFTGKALFWVGWPLLFIYLRFSKRTRVLIRSGEDLLVVKGWLGSGGWSFPGGGLHRREDPLIGAVREVFEEVGIQLDPNALTYLFEQKVNTPQGFSYTCIAYAIDLQGKPKLKNPSGELVEIEWKPISQLIKHPRAKYLLIPALSAWEKQAKM